jgi:hypothetical protein
VSESEIDRLDSPDNVVELVSGTKVRILSLRMRQLFKLLRIITRGGAVYLPTLRDALASAGDDDSAEILGTQLMSIAVFALPEAENEAIEFIHSVVDIVDPMPGADKQAREFNNSKRSLLLAELDNPEIEDLLTIIEAVVNQEKSDLMALGKRLAAMFKVAIKTDAKVADKESDETPPSIEQIPASSGPLPERVISSPLNTDGLTTSSSTLPSDVSDK